MVGITVGEHAGAAAGLALLAAGAGVGGVASLLSLLRGAGRSSAARRRAAIQNNRWGIAESWLLLLAGGVGVALHVAAARLPANHVSRLVGAERRELTRIRGVVVDEPRAAPATRNNPFVYFQPATKTRFILDARELRTGAEPLPIAGLVRVVVDDTLALAPGDDIELTGWIYRPVPARNPGATDWAYQSRLQSVLVGMSVESAAHAWRLSSPRFLWRRIQSALRRTARGALLEPFAQVDEGAARRVLDAMVLGQRSAAGREVNEAFLRTGSIHLLAVSGFHVGLVAVLVWWAARLLSRSVRAASLAVIAAVLTYMAITEANAPVLRAGVMAIVYCLARLSKRPVSAINWLCGAMILLLAWSPLALLQAGFQLSFLQVLALILIGPRLNDLLRWRSDEGLPRDADTPGQFLLMRAAQLVGGWLAVAVVAWLIALPATLLHFGRFAPWGALQSALIVPWAMLTIATALVSTLMAPIPLVSVATGFALRWATGGMLYCVDALAALPATLLEVRQPGLWTVLPAYALLAAALLHFRRPWSAMAAMGRGALRWRRCAATLLIAAGGAAIPLAAALWPIPRPSGLDVHVLDVGSGSATLLRSASGEAGLVDLGTIANHDVGELAARAALALGVERLRWLVISHADYDHYSGVPTFAEHVPIARVCLNPYFQSLAREESAEARLLGALAAARGADADPPQTLSAGQRLALEGVTIETLWPPEDLDARWKANDRCLVLRAVVGARSLLIPGDVERDALRALLARFDAGEVELRSDVLIAPHHGAVVPGQTEAFLRAVEPEVVIVSTAKPRPELDALIARALGGGVRVVSTRDVGAVTIRMAPDGALCVETPFAPPAP